MITEKERLILEFIKFGTSFYTSNWVSCDRNNQSNQ